MSNIFSTLKKYEQSWKEVNNQKFDEDDLKMIISGKVVEGDYGLSAQLNLADGGCYYISLDEINSTAKLGDDIDLAKCHIVTLAKEGHDNIIRIRC